MRSVIDVTRGMVAILNGVCHRYDQKETVNLNEAHRQCATSSSMQSDKRMAILDKVCHRCDQREKKLSARSERRKITVDEVREKKNRRCVQRGTAILNKIYHRHVWINLTAN